MARQQKDPRDMTFEEALAVLRDPGGDGRTRVSHGFTGEPMRCVRCRRPTREQAAGVVVPPGPRCACK
jgi:hypothetical protein